jgi:hypothetical protein
MPLVRWFLRSACVLVLVGGAGCGGGNRGDGRYIPAEETARRALETALAAWRDGVPVDGPAHGLPALQVVDTHRRQGQQLRGYDILGAVPAEGGHRRFAVRLLLEDPAEEQKVRFVVLGEDPLWIFRQEDLDMVLHMEMDMTADTEPAGKPAPTK